MRNRDLAEQGKQSVESANAGQIDDRRGVADDHLEHSQLLQGGHVLFEFRHVVMRANTPAGQ